MGIDKIAGWIELPIGTEQVDFSEIEMLLRQAVLRRAARDLEDLDDQRLLSGRIDRALAADVDSQLLRVRRPEDNSIVLPDDHGVHGMIDMVGNEVVDVEDLREYLRGCGFGITFVYADRRNDFVPLLILATEAATYEHPGNSNDDPSVQIAREKSERELLARLLAFIEQGKLSAFDAATHAPCDSALSPDRIELLPDGRLLALEGLGQLVRLNEAGFSTISVQSSAVQLLAAQQKTARQQNGLFTLREAADIWAKANGRDGFAVLARMLTAYISGELTIRDPDTGWPLADGRPAMSGVHWVTPQDLDSTFAKWNEPNRFLSLVAKPKPSGEDDLKVDNKGSRPPDNSDIQDDKILAALVEAGYDPLAIPAWKNGNPSPAKNAARKALVGTPLFTSKKVFDNSWDRCLGTRIRVENTLLYDPPKK